MERRREIIGPEANCDARYLNERLRAGHTVHHRYSAHMSRVHILATGGTIAGAASSDVDGSYQAGSLGIARLVAAVPGLHSLANLTWEQVSKTGSQDMHDTLWRELARRVTRLFTEDLADAVVITHGTDTIEETAYFLHLTVRSSRPVVLTGAMRPATSLSADGPLNLYNAVAVAANADAFGRGVIVVVNDELHSARDVTKASTTDVHAFVSPRPGLLGTVRYGSIRYFRRPTHRHTIDSQFAVTSIEQLPRVDILYAHASMPADLVRASVDRGARGIVIAGMGNGNVPAEVVGMLTRVAKEDIAVVRSTRVMSGEVERNIEMSDDLMGTIAADHLNPQKSRVLLQLCLAHRMDNNAVQDAFYEY